MQYKFTGGSIVDTLLAEAVASLSTEKMREFCNSIIPDSFTVTMQVNGFEVDFGRITTLLLERYEACVEERAAQLINDRAAELVGKLQEFKEEVERKVSDLFPLSEAY